MERFESAAVGDALVDHIATFSGDDSISIGAPGALAPDGDPEYRNSTCRLSGFTADPRGQITRLRRRRFRDLTQGQGRLAILVLGCHTRRQGRDAATRLSQDRLLRSRRDHWIVSKPPAPSDAAAQNALNSGIQSIAWPLVVSGLYSGTSPGEK
jgi:hypothetical protein